MYLEVGTHRLYGGPVAWQPGRRREILEGQKHLTLKPGEDVRTLVCTNPADEVGRTLTGYHGRLLWRIQVRRGLVAVHDREVSATAVIGVEFQDSDIARNQP
jgi:hypothetical protein